MSDLHSTVALPLSYFPSDVLSSVTVYLYWRDIRALLLCGSKSLEKKLANGGGIREITLGDGDWSLSSRRAVSLLSTIHSVRVRIVGRSDSEEGPSFADWIPSSVTKLDYEGYIPKSFGWDAVLRDSIPNLRHLIIEASNSFYPTPIISETAIRALPEGLETLHLSSCDFQSQLLCLLPPTLQSLRINGIIGETDGKLALPATLHTLGIDQAVNSLASLPSSLTALSIEFSQLKAVMSLSAYMPSLKWLTMGLTDNALEELAMSRTTWPDLLAILPQTLEYCLLGIYHYGSFPLSDQIAIFPPTVTSFSPFFLGNPKTSFNTNEVLKSLPPTLTSAELNHLCGDSPLSVYQYAILPRNLRTLSLPELMPFLPDNGPQNCGNISELLHMALSNLPKRLTRLKWHEATSTRYFLDKSTILSLPPHLTSIEAPVVSFKTFEGLEFLYLARLQLTQHSNSEKNPSPLSSSDLAFLPRTLLYFSIEYSGMSSSSNWENWMPMIARRCPSLQHLSFIVHKCPSSFASDLKYLPKSLVELTVQPCLDLGDEHVPDLPQHLTFLYLQDDAKCRVSDQSSTLWPPLLESLTIPATELLTEACCENFQSLNDLQLGNTTPNFWETFKYGFNPNDYCEPPFDED